MPGDCDCGCSSGGKKRRHLTRAVKNARYLKEKAPHLSKDQDSNGGFGTGLPIDTLRKLHRLSPASPLLKDHPAVSEFLKTHGIPVPFNQPVEPLLSGTIYFALITFTTSSGTLSVSTADMETIIQYATHAVVPILQYAEQYGTTKLAVSPTPLTYSVNLPSGVFSDSDLQGWVNDMYAQNSLPSNSSIYVVCPSGISTNNPGEDNIGENGGYHSKANIPYAVAGVYSSTTPPTPLSLQDEADIFAMVISHEMAEMIVDPTVDLVNPEVCDPCDINCRNLTRVYFDAQDNFLGVNQDSPPGGFPYTYYICAIVKAEGARNCPASAADCQYAPLTRSLEFVMGQSTFSKDDVTNSLSFPTDFWLRVSGFTNESLNLTTLIDLDNVPNPPFTFSTSVDPSLNAPNGLSTTQVATISANLPTFSWGKPPTLPTDPTFQQNPQDFLFPFTVTFLSTAAFDALNLDQSVFVSVTASLAVGEVTVSAQTSLVLSSGEDPRFEDIDPNNPTEYPSWLSFDLRFFKVTVPSSGPNQIADAFGATMTKNPADAPGFISSILTNINAGNGTVGFDSFDALTQNEDQSALEFLPQDDKGNYVFNFALARVRLTGYTAGAVAKKVRVFFRLFAASSTATNFEPSTTYRFWPPNPPLNGVTVPLLGVQNNEYVTVPCFASPRINYDVTTNKYAPNSMQTKPEDGPNVRQITVNPGTEVDTFFGCWLDLNQPQQEWMPATPPTGNLDGPWTGSLLSLNAVATNASHQCLIAEIRDDDTPIPVGVASNYNKLAQRNIAWINGPNPGTDPSRAMPHPFEVSATPVGASAPDEIMVFWGNTPPGSLASFHFPAVNSGDILVLADSLYAFHQLTAADANTIQCPTESNGVTFIPLPTSTVRYAGLLTLDLPPGITFGDQYDIVIRQTTIKSATITPPPPTPPPPPIPQVIPTSQHPHSETAKTLSTVTAPRTFTWRQVLGIFQVSIPITKKGQLLLPEERLLSWLLWKLTVVPTTSR